MGTVKEHDVILTYLQHMDEQKKCATIPSHCFSFLPCVPHDKKLS